MTRMVRQLWAISSIAMAGLVVVIAGAATAGPRTVHVVIEQSRFVVEGGALTVRAGETVRLVVHNRDPIDHELIAGDLDTQLRHERGTDRHHDGAHGAVSVAAGETVETIHTFTATSSWLGCHLPGHWDYGMQLSVRVLGS